MVLNLQALADGESSSSDEDEPNNATSPPPAHSTEGSGGKSSKPRASKPAHMYKPSDRINVWWGGQLGWLKGTVLEAWQRLEGQMIKVRYDDDNTTECFDPEGDQWKVELILDEPAEASRYVPMRLQCSRSHAPLIDPAKGERCNHLAMFNYDSLAEHIAKHGACPYHGCSAAIRTRTSILRDDWLRAQAKALLSAGLSPDQVVYVWDRREVVTTAPTADGASSSDAPRRIDVIDVDPVIDVDEDEDGPPPSREVKVPASSPLPPPSSSNTHTHVRFHVAKPARLQWGQKITLQLSNPGARPQELTVEKHRFPVHMQNRPKPPSNFRMKLTEPLDAPPIVSQILVDEQPLRSEFWHILSNEGTSAAASSAQGAPAQSSSTSADTMCRATPSTTSTPSNGNTTPRNSVATTSPPGPRTDEIRARMRYEQNGRGSSKR